MALPPVLLLLEGLVVLLLVLRVEVLELARLELLAVLQILAGLVAVESVLVLVLGPEVRMASDHGVE